MLEQIRDFVERLKHARHATVFTGAGISFESGVPTFRGENGIWSKYNPRSLELDYFYSYPKESWWTIREIFYAYFGKAQPNAAHLFIGKAEVRGYIKDVITQNIDNLHQLGGSKNVHEFHGNAQKLICTRCGEQRHVDPEILRTIPVKCKICSGLVKPDFVFFGEGIPDTAYQNSLLAAKKTDLMIIIGALGEVMPAALMPREAKINNAFIIEINPEPSNFTSSITDMFIQGKAGEVCKKAADLLFDGD